MNLTEKQQLIAYLKTHGLWLKKEAGQHFLVDRDVLDKIMEAAELEPTDTVLEIGPGVGTLTRALAEAAPRGLVLAIERDYKLTELLRKEFKSEKNVKIIHQDILEFQIKNQKSNLKMINQNGKTDKESTDHRLPASPASGLTTDYELVSNIPYQISGAILRKFLDPNEANRPSELILMVQKEVAERWAALPGNSDRGIPTILVELFGRAEIVSTIPKTAFFPVPEVDSAIIKIICNTSPNTLDKCNECNEESVTYLQPKEAANRIMWLAKIGFAAKRRTILNSLSAGLRQDKGIVSELLDKADIPHEYRAEDLDLAAWRRLATILNNELKSG